MKSQLSEQESSDGLKMEASTSTGHNSSNSNINNNNYGSTSEGKCNYDSPPLTKSKFLIKVFRLLVFGLFIYLGPML
jgi:hypothetical protein